ncbi:single-stranded DNA-binding family protein [Synechococcus sp. SYN20]|uniref:single-stranded DNA-binding protein n=1 Tax=Synechococcus sp. SYN20 TaxID=1050714 RepID=UPI001648C945|nr:single-stranded DNA-binding protein [Synechococcus sp. SYN20]QNJ25893.1 single-stranded DNA-binding family protein [Synechococcus sp. SYN20]
MASISIAGKVTRAPEIKFFDSGSQLCTFSVIDKEYVRPAKGQDEAAGQFYDVQVWGKYAEIISDRVVKGSRVAVHGKAVWEEYTNKSGEKRKVLRVNDPNVTFLDNKEEAEALKAAAGGGGSFGAPSTEEIPF